MARADSVDSTLAGRGEIDRDAIVVGGGAAGLSAAVFLARYGLETLVLARGTSAIRQCAHLENYPGFPGGISPERFLSLARTQVDYEGGTVREELVERIERTPLPGHEDTDIDAAGRDPGRGGFRVESDDGDYLTRYVLTATAYDGDMLDPLADEIETDGEHGFVDSDAGRTAVDGLYTAGWMTDEVDHQVAASVGHGARAALALARDDLGARYWPELAECHQDWVVDGDRYAGDEAWYADTREWFDETVVVDDLDDDIVEAGFEYISGEFLDRCLDADERAERDREGQYLLLEQLDDAVIREYAGSLEGTDDE